MNCPLPAPRVARVVAVVGCLFSLAAVAAGGQAARGRCFPVNVALHPAGRFAAVQHSGCGQHEVRIIDLESGEPVSQAASSPSGRPRNRECRAAWLHHLTARRFTWPSAGADKADDIKLNEIVWRCVRGPPSPMPAPRRAAFYIAHANDDDDDK